MARLGLPTQINCQGRDVTPAEYLAQLVTETIVRVNLLWEEGTILERGSFTWLEKPDGYAQDPHDEEKMARMFQVTFTWEDWFETMRYAEDKPDLTPLTFTNQAPA